MNLCETFLSNVITFMITLNKYFCLNIRYSNSMFEIIHLTF